MKRLLVFVSAILPALLLLNSCGLNDKKSVDKTTSSDSVRVAASDTNKTAQADKVFKSLDGGETWQDIGEALPEPVKDADGVNRNGIFADANGLWVTVGNEIFHNQPTTKTPIWEKETYSGKFSSIAPGKAGMYAYNYGGAGIFQKANGTNIWSPVFTNFTEKRIYSFFETAGGTLFIGSERGLFKSTNGGKSWKQLPVGGGGKMVESNAVLLLTGEAGILRSTDDGENWTVVISEGGVGIDVANIKGGFAAINYSEAAKTRRIRTSYDGGKTWQPIDAGFPGQTIDNTNPQSINVVNPAHGNADSTRRAKDAPLPVPEYKTSIIQVGDDFYYGHTLGIYKSSDKGKTWKLVRCAKEGKMFKLYVSGNVIYAIQVEAHC